MKIVFLLVVMLMACLTQAKEQIYLAPLDYIKQQTAQSKLPKSQVLELTDTQYKQAKKLASKASFRNKVRYWQKDGKTIWVLQAIGKVQFITAGYTVQNKQLNDVRVLIYRESHGYEVANSKFEQQFEDIGLNDKNRLDESTSSIAGATLSVNSMRQMAVLALYLDSLIK